MRAVEMKPLTKLSHLSATVEVRTELFSENMVGIYYNPTSSQRNNGMVLE
jgi:hypothetical protein